jgi:hypothetical protein
LDKIEAAGTAVAGYLCSREHSVVVGAPDLEASFTERFGNGSLEAREWFLEG